MKFLFPYLMTLTSTLAAGLVSVISFLISILIFFAFVLYFPLKKKKESESS